ncbi:uncharacterized protein [Temnothorax nylanderi]|uniref:uncharacterized protein n=1 Tax=Temnothorax nylanderi TaxID=102681 RepID=UPI003A86107A
MGLKINTNKTKMMIFSRASHEGALLHLDGVRIERVASIEYLGCLITEDLDPDREVRRRIEIARGVFNKMRAFFCEDNLNLRLRRRMVKCYVWSVLLYGVEAWTLKASTLNRLETFEMWILRRMLRISWVDRVTNAEVWRRAGAQRELLITVKCRKIEYLGHVLRGEKYRLLQLILKGRIEGRRGIGRKWLSWLRNIRAWTGVRSAEELFRIAVDRITMARRARVIANVRGTGQGT